MVGQAHCTVKTAAKVGDRLEPRLGRNLEPIENRLQGLWDYTMGPCSQMTTRPVQQLQVAVQGHRQKAAVAGSTRATRTDSLRGCGDNLQCWRCRHQRLGMLIQFDGTEPAIAARRHASRTWPRVWRAARGSSPSAPDSHSASRPPAPAGLPVRDPVARLECEAMSINPVRPLAQEKQPGRRLYRARMLHIGSRYSGPVGRRPSHRHDGQMYQGWSRLSSIQ